MHIYQIIKRWHTGYSISEISRALGSSRKTVRRYVRAVEACGLSREAPLPARDELTAMLLPLIPTTERTMPAREQFVPYREEITRLLTRTSDPLKAKTLYEVLCYRYDTTASYSSFKRYVRQLPLPGSKRTTCRIEVEPGQEIQIDYAKVGRLLDPSTGKQRTVYAFIGTLSHSRYKFIEYVYTQDQRSFVSSHVRILDFFGGAPRCLMIDNLKSGILKPDRYDPALNPLYRDLAEHYHAFIDPARVKRPKDKGKVERTVQQVRELFRKLKTPHDDLDLSFANQMALTWCRDENGMRVHGTTGEKPREAFIEREQAALQPLPDSPFELATWKQVKVHPDQYIQFEKKAYSVPERYVGRRLWARGDDRWLRIYDDNFYLVKQHVRTHRHRHTDWSDFPKPVRMMLSDDSVQRLLEKARQIGPAMHTYIERILEPHAKINMRKVQGMLALAKHYNNGQMEAAAEEGLLTRQYRYQEFKKLLAEEESVIPISEQTITRSAEYFIH
jgi:transposase